MKLIKTMLTGMILLVFAIGQEQTDGGPPPPPPCDPNATYPVADPGPDGAGPGTGAGRPSRPSLGRSQAAEEASAPDGGVGAGD